LQFSASDVLAHEAHEMTPKGKRELIHKEESYAIIGACFAVYKDKGFFFKIFASFSVFRGQINL